MTNILLLVLFALAAVFWRQVVAIAFCSAITLIVCGALYVCQEIDSESAQSTSGWAQAQQR